MGKRQRSLIGAREPRVAATACRAPKLTRDSPSWRLANPHSSHFSASTYTCSTLYEAGGWPCVATSRVGMTAGGIEPVLGRNFPPTCSLLSRPHPGRSFAGALRTERAGARDGPWCRPEGPWMPLLHLASALRSGGPWRQLEVSFLWSPAEGRPSPVDPPLPGPTPAKSGCSTKRLSAPPSGRVVAPLWKSEPTKLGINDVVSGTRGLALPSRPPANPARTPRPNPIRLEGSQRLRTLS